MKKNIIDNFENVDIFIHAWNTKLSKYESSISGLNTGYVLEDLASSLINTYSPKEIEIEESKIFEESKEYPYPVPEGWPANNVFSMFYSTKICVSLKRKHEYSNNFKYDWVFRTRFDYAINRKFTESILKDLKDDTFYSPHVVREGNIHCHGDFNFGSSKVIDCLGETFDNITRYGKTSTTLAVESMSYRQIVENKYKIEEFDLYNQFPPSQHAACWHSLWGHR